MGTLRNTLVGSFTDRLHVALEVMHTARDRGFKRIDRLTPEVRRDLEQRHGEAGRRPPSDEEVSYGVDSRAAQDGLFKTAVALERWATRAANTYAAVELLYTQRAALTRLDGILDQQRRTAELLERIATALEDRPAQL